MVSSWIGTRNTGDGENCGRRGENGFFSWIEMIFWMDK